jgi:hypothetical protein
VGARGGAARRRPPEARAPAKGAARPELQCVRRVGCARQGTEVVGRLWGRSPEHVSRQRPWCAGGRARRRAWRPQVGRSAAVLNRRATSCFDGPARRSPLPIRCGTRPGAWREGERTPMRLGARDSLGKARAGAGTEAAGVPRRGARSAAGAGDVAVWRGAASAGRNCVTVSLFEHVKLQKVV